MIRKLLAYCVLVAVLAYAPVQAQMSGGQMFPGPGTAHSAGCAATLALDGTPAKNSGSGTTLAGLSLTTTGTSDVVVIDIRAFTIAVTASVSSANLTWNVVPGTTTSGINDGSGHFQWQFYATKTSALTSEAITVTFSGLTTVNAAIVWAVSGANTSSPFDGNAGTTITSTAPSITTTNANDWVSGALQTAANSATAGSGWVIVDQFAFDSFLTERVTPVPSATGTFNATISGDTIQTGIVSAIKRSC